MTTLNLNPSHTYCRSMCAVLDTSGFYNKSRFSHRFFVPPLSFIIWKRQPKTESGQVQYVDEERSRMSRSVIKTTSEIDSEPSILIRSQENSWPPFKLQCLFVLKLLETFPILSFCYRKKKYGQTQRPVCQGSFSNHMDADMTYHIEIPKHGICPG